MDISRRDYLKSMGAAGLAASTGGFTPQPAHAAQAETTTQPRQALNVRKEYPPPRIAKKFLWISAEDFTHRGGWHMDTQFVYLMGSSYLIARSADAPVDDAWMELDVQQACRYRIWVRMRDWLPEYHPGTFQVVLDDAPLPKAMGEADRDDWHWAIAGDVELTAGTHRLALHDQTGGFGRCAALILTTEMDYVPPHEVDALMHERLRLNERTTEPKDLGHFDVVVVGGGPAGCPAAIASARLGIRTALVHDRPVLGGNASSELGVPSEGASIIQPNARETGVIEEVTRLQVHEGHGTLSIPYATMTEAEPQLTVLLHTRILGVEMDSSERIKTLLGVDVRDGSPVKISAGYFIDCTGDGWVGHYAGAQYRIGWEAQWQYDEPDAPEQADLITMSGTLMGPFCFEAVDVGEPVEFTPPPWAAQLPDLISIGRRPSPNFYGEWWLETPGDRDDLYDTERVRDELIRISYGYWNYVKNEWQEREKAANYDLVDVPHSLAKRETRRLVGDTMLTMNDIMGDTHFPDTIAYAGWPLDVHNPQGIYGGAEGPYYCNHVFDGIRELPFGSLYSANIDNLLVSGRCASVSRLALGTVRVQRTLATLGQAAGTAAALCVRHNCTPRTVRNDHITELQQLLLKFDQYIPHITNQDPADLARSATVRASSVASGFRFDREDMTLTDTYHPMDGHRRAYMFPVMHGKGIGNVTVLLRSERDEATPIRLHLREASALADFSSTNDLTVVESTIPPYGDHWIEFAVNVQTSADFAWFWLDAVEGVSWPLVETSSIATRRAYAVKGTDGPDAWEPRPESYACVLDPSPELHLDYSPENVINGITRVSDTTIPNRWRSDPDESFPQWIELTFPEPVTINTVHLTFSTDLNSRRLSRRTDPKTGEAVLSSLTGYKIQARAGSDWTTIVKVSDNIQRWRRHQFNSIEIQALRVEITHAVLMDSAEVYEIRAYHE